MNELGVAIGEMRIGQEGYCVGWSFFKDLDGQLYIDISHTVIEKKGNTASVLIRCTSDGLEVVESTIDGEHLRLKDDTQLNYMHLVNRKTGIRTNRLQPIKIVKE